MKGAPACSRHLDGCVAQLEANSLPSSPKGREFQLVSIFTNHQFAASRTTARAHSFSVTLFQNQLHLSGLPEQTDGIWNRSGGQTRVQPILTLLLAALPSPVSKCHRRVPWEPSAVQHVRPDISGTAPPSSKHGVLRGQRACGGFAGAPPPSCCPRWDAGVCTVASAAR